MRLLSCVWLHDRNSSLNVFHALSLLISNYIIAIIMLKYNQLFGTQQIGYIHITLKMHTVISHRIIEGLEETYTMNFPIPICVFTSDISVFCQESKLFDTHMRMLLRPFQPTKATLDSLPIEIILQLKPNGGNIWRMWYARCKQSATESTHHYGFRV